MIDSLSSRLEMLSCPRASAIMVITAIWLVYALVDATPISAPALMWTPQWVPRAIALPTVLVTPTQRAPLRYGSGANFSELGRVRIIKEPVASAQTHGPRTKNRSWKFVTLKRLTALNLMRIEGMDGSDGDSESGSYRPIESTLLTKSNRVLHEVQILAYSRPSSVSAIPQLWLTEVAVSLQTWGTAVQENLLQI